MSESNNQKLERICQAYIDGQRAGAELALHEWARHDDCPDDALVLLACALTSRGETEHALAVLHAQVDLASQDYSEDLGKMLVAVLTEADLSESAQRVAYHCFHQLGHQGQMAEWLEAVDAPGFGEQICKPDAAIEELAMELTTQFRLIPSLVAAQKIEPDQDDISLLRDVMRRMAPHAHDQRQTLILSLALAELSLLVKDHDEARRWAYRGLRIDPLSASLALILAQVQGDASMGPAPFVVLDHVADAYPQYPDVQAAAIRTTLAAGQHTEARLRLAQWREREPGQPLAAQLAKELAA